jgi:hypothetical protein
LLQFIGWALKLADLPWLIRAFLIQAITAHAILIRESLIQGRVITAHAVLIRAFLTYIHSPIQPDLTLTVRADARLSGEPQFGGRRGRHLKGEKEPPRHDEADCVESGV